MPGHHQREAECETELSARRLAGYRRRYRSLITEGQRLNPPPPRTGKRGRPKLGPAGSLLRRLDEYQDDVLRFAVDLRYREVGEAMGCSEAAARRSVHEAIKSLRELNIEPEVMA